MPSKVEGQTVPPPAVSQDAPFKSKGMELKELPRDRVAEKSAHAAPFRRNTVHTVKKRTFLMNVNSFGPGSFVAEFPVPLNNRAESSFVRANDEQLSQNRAWVSICDLSMGGGEHSTKLLQPCKDILKLLLNPELHGVSPTG